MLLPTLFQIKPSIPRSDENQLYLTMDSLSVLDLDPPPLSAFDTVVNTKKSINMNSNITSTNMCEGEGGVGLFGN